MRRLLQLPWLRPRGKARLETPPEQRRFEPPQREAAAIADLNAGFAKPRGHKRRRQLAMRARRANVDRQLRERGRK